MYVYVRVSNTLLISSFGEFESSHAFPRCFTTAGYAEDCYELHKFLLRQHISGFRFESIEDDGSTGNFEVYVNDVLVHSKATMPGHGRASSLRERNRILAAMQTGD